MNEEQKKFWEILSTPYNRSCRNCRHAVADSPFHCDGGFNQRCYTSDYAIIPFQELKDHWVWDGITDR